MHALDVDNMAQSAGRVEADLVGLKKAAGQVVGSVFYGTLLKTMRESELKGMYGHGGRGEEVFSAQLHGMWAEQMGTQSGGGLGEVLYRHLAKQQTLMSGQSVPGGGTRG